jgi:hypothetical protein
MAYDMMFNWQFYLNAFAALMDQSVEAEKLI